MKLIQITNPSTGAIADGALIPLGVITRKRDCKSEHDSFELQNTGSNILAIATPGYFTVAFMGNLNVNAAAAPFKVSLLMDGIEVDSASVETTAAGYVNLVILKEIRVFKNCQSMPANNPVSLSLRISGAGVTDGNTNLLVKGG